jgi:hypothetical protein
MEPVELAYLAGVVDADGYITIQRSNGLRSYTARIGITGNRREPHNLARDLFDGRIVRQQEGTNCWTWYRSGRAAVPALTALLPYLRVKVEQAQIALWAQQIAARDRSGLRDDFLEQLHFECVRRNGRKPLTLKQNSGIRTETGIDALGRIVREYPQSWDRKRDES